MLTHILCFPQRMYSLQKANMKMGESLAGLFPIHSESSSIAWGGWGGGGRDFWNLSYAVTRGGGAPLSLSLSLDHLPWCIHLKREEEEEEEEEGIDFYIFSQKKNLVVVLEEPQSLLHLSLAR